MTIMVHVNHVLDNKMDDISNKVMLLKDDVCQD